MLESGSTPWGGNRNLAQNKKNNWNEKGARLGLIEDWSSFLFLDRKTDDLRHKDKKNIFSAGVFLDKKTDSLRHKDIKDIFQELKELEGVKELRQMFGGVGCGRKSVFLDIKT